MPSCKLCSTGTEHPKACRWLSLVAGHTSPSAVMLMIALEPKAPTADDQRSALHAPKCSPAVPAVPAHLDVPPYRISTIARRPFSQVRRYIRLCRDARQTVPGHCSGLSFEASPSARSSFKFASRGPCRCHTVGTLSNRSSQVAQISRCLRRTI